MKYIYNIDLHVHTQKYSQCAELLSPYDLDIVAQKKNIHGIVITEHNVIWTKDEIKEINRNFQFTKLYRGVEVSCQEGHFVVIGIEQLGKNIKGIALTTLIEKVHSQNGTIIWAHHHQFNIGEQDISGINAIEVASSITFGENEREAIDISKRRTWVPVAGSDAHCIECVGATFTSFQKLPENEEELAFLINQGDCNFGRQNI